MVGQGEAHGRGRSRRKRPDGQGTSPAPPCAMGPRLSPSARHSRRVSGAGRRPARSGAASSMPSARSRRMRSSGGSAWPTAICASKRHLPRARRQRRPAVVDQSSAAADRRGRLEAAVRLHHPARRVARARAARRLWRRKLVAEGALPAAAIVSSPEYLRAVCGVPPPGGRYLSLYAADVGRGPDGRWWVLGDRTQAPSGAGYALENRLVLSRAFSDLYKSMNVPRVAPFFEAFRDSLRARADRDEPRIGVLSPGASAKPISSTRRWRAISASCWSRATISPSPTIVSTFAPSPG